MVIGWGFSASEAGCFSLREIRAIADEREIRLLADLRNMRYVATCIVNGYARHSIKPSDLFELKGDEDELIGEGFEPGEWEQTLQSYGQRTECKTGS